ncbi:MAG: hypothetical protein QOE71_3104 [Pseudonocardiales bacterium]|jgi:hypothetical protein|nr:hypothetical protein [Pseudonocardiales bacterium]
MSRPIATNSPGAAGPRLTIDRLRLRATGLDDGAARRLATLVGQGLAPSLQLSTDTAAIDTLRIEVTANAGETPEALSRRIIDAVGRALAAEEVAP